MRCCYRRKGKGKCNYMLMLGIGLLLGAILPCKVSLVLCALLVCILSVSAFRK